ncbi:MAG: hypothetical protein Q9191_007748 [Dirinaria sp. TL-2023a]
MPRFLPGFYYDEAKGKYFKVQPSHAVPQDSKYSAQNIKLQQENAMYEKQKAEKSQRNRNSRIQKHPALQHALVGGFRLTSEAGISRVDPSTVVNDAWVKGLDREWFIQDPLGKQAEIRHLVYDDASTCFIYNLTKDKSSFIQSGFLEAQREARMPSFQGGKQFVTEASYQLLLTHGIEVREFNSCQRPTDDRQISSISIDVNRVIL